MRCDSHTVVTVRRRRRAISIALVTPAALAATAAVFAAREPLTTTAARVGPAGVRLALVPVDPDWPTDGHASLTIALSWTTETERFDADVRRLSYSEFRSDGGEPVSVLLGL